MLKLIKNYIESYWWYFLLQSLVAITFGLFALTTPIRTLGTIVFVAAGALVLMGVVGVLRMVHDWTRRPHRRWGDSLVIALVELGVGTYFLFHIDAGFQVSGIIFGLIVLIRGLFDLVVSLTSIKDSIDKVFWLVAGVAGVVLGLVILNHPGEANIMLFWLFGAYILIFGISNLFYALHIRSSVQTASIAHITKRAARAAKPATKQSAKKATKSTTKK